MSAISRVRPADGVQDDNGGGMDADDAEYAPTDLMPLGSLLQIPNSVGNGYVELLCCSNLKLSLEGAGWGFMMLLSCPSRLASSVLYEGRPLATSPSRSRCLSTQSRVAGALASFV